MKVKWIEDILYIKKPEVLWHARDVVTYINFVFKIFFIVVKPCRFETEIK